MKVFRKTGVSTLINILGMSVAFAAAMILIVQVRWDTTYDANFEGHEQVFRVENNWIDDGLFSSHFCRPMIERIRLSSPNIEAVGTMRHRSSHSGGQYHVLSLSFRVGGRFGQGIHGCRHCGHKRGLCRIVLRR